MSIRSAAKLSYADTQKVIDGHLLSDTVVAPEHSASALEHDLKALHSLAQHLRTKRLQDGALILNSTSPKFTLDDNGFPVDCEQSVSDQAKELVEEVYFMPSCGIAKLLTNYSSCSLPTLPLRNVLQSTYQNKHYSAGTTHPSTGA